MVIYSQGECPYDAKSEIWIFPLGIYPTGGQCIVYNVFTLFAYPFLGHTLGATTPCACLILVLCDSQYCKMF